MNIIIKTYPDSLTDMNKARFWITASENIIFFPNLPLEDILTHENDSTHRSMATVN